MSRAERRTLTRAERGTAVARFASAVVAAIALLVFIGWGAGIAALRGVSLGPSVVLPNAALGFLLGAIALWGAREERAPNSAPRLTTRLAASLVVLLGAAALTQRLADVDLHIDLALFGDQVRTYATRTPGVPPTPGRIAFSSSLCFLCAGIALLTLDREVGRSRRPAQWVTFVGLAIAAVAVIGYLFGARPLRPIDRAAGMALVTALTFIILLVGILAARASRGGIALLTGPDLGGVLARRLLPTLVVVPTGLGWLWLRGREEMLVTREGGVSLFVVATIATLSLVVLLSAQALRDVDRERTAALAREAAARRAAEAASRAKSDFLAVMSHELRTPLNAIIGYQSLLSDGITGPVNDAQRQQLGRIRVGATHLVGLIDEILTLSRIEAGREQMRIETVDVAHAVDDAAALAAPLAAAKALTFTAHPPPVPVELTTDVAKLRQVLLNLLSNAVKFTEHGEIELVASVDDRDVIFRVRDTGIGISAEHLERIFDPFWQVEQPTTRRVAGTGLGLDVSRRLATLLGGELTVESTFGVGSRFTLRLPRHAG